MISTFAFLSLLLIFVRIYSILSLLFLDQNRTKFAERVITFNSQSIFKFINRFFIGIILLTNIIYGFLLIM